MHPDLRGWTCAVGPTHLDPGVAPGAVETNAEAKVALWNALQVMSAKQFVVMAWLWLARRDLGSGQVRR